MIEMVTKFKQYEEKLIRCQKQTINHFRQHIAYLSVKVPHPKQHLIELMQRTDEYSIRLRHQIESILFNKKIIFSSSLSKINTLNPVHKVSRQLEKVNQIRTQFKQSMRLILEKSNNNISRLNHMLNTVSPISTLDRGYAIVTNTKTNLIVTGAKELSRGDKLRIKFSAAEVNSIVDEIHEN